MLDSSVRGKFACMTGVYYWRLGERLHLRAYGDDLKIIDRFISHGNRSSPGEVDIAWRSRQSMRLPFELAGHDGHALIPKFPDHFVECIHIARIAIVRRLKFVHRGLKFRNVETLI